MEADDTPLPRTPPTPVTPKRRRGVIAGVLGFLLIGAVSIKHLHNVQAGVPYAASAVAGKVSVQVLPSADAAARAAQLAGRPVGVLAAQSVVVGQLTFRTPDNAPHIGQYSLIVIDKGLRQPVSLLAGVGPSGSVIRAGWDARYDQVLAKAGAGSRPVRPNALSFAPDTTSPVTFEAAGRGISDPARQLTFVLAFFSVDGHLYWQTTLPA